MYKFFFMILNIILFASCQKTSDTNFVQPKTNEYFSVDVIVIMSQQNRWRYLENILVSIDSINVSTNKNGAAHFDSLLSGEHILSIIDSNYVRIDSVINLNSNKEILIRMQFPPEPATNYNFSDYINLDIGKTWKYKYSFYGGSCNNVRREGFSDWKVTDFNENNGFVIQQIAYGIEFYLDEPLPGPDTVRYGPDSTYYFIKSSNDSTTFYKYFYHNYYDDYVQQFKCSLSDFTSDKDTLEFESEYYTYNGFKADFYIHTEHPLDMKMILVKEVGISQLIQRWGVNCVDKWVYELIE